MNIQYDIDNNDIIRKINADFIKFARANSQGKFAPTSCLGTSIFSAMQGQETFITHQLLLQKVRILRKPIAYRYRCDSPSLARFMVMNIIPKGKNCIHYENIIEDELPMPQEIHFKTDGRSDIYRCSLCNRYKMLYEWLDPVHFSALEIKAQLSWSVSYKVCMSCRNTII